MTILEMLGQSGVLTLLGMSFVFGFLVIMIISISVIGKLIHILGLDKDIATVPQGVNVSHDTIHHAEITAAITAAINKYRNKG